MLNDILIGMPTMLVSLLLQLLLLLVVIRYHHHNLDRLNDASFWLGLTVLSIVMLLLVFGNLMQIAIWAWVFLYLDEFDKFSAAFYHSAVNFASLGYGDIVMSEKYRLLGALEAINGVLMIGVSTATLMAVFQKLLRSVSNHKK